MITYPDLNKKGRLGNQLFQIASTIGIARAAGQDFSFPEWEYQHCFENKLPTISTIPGFTLVETSCDYGSISLDAIEPPEDISLEGYFQSEKYFINAEKEIRKCFEFSEEISKYIDKKYSHVLKKYDTAIHVRRGDYLNLKEVYHTLSHLYYFQAATILNVKKAVVFSDDISWCKTIFKDTDCYFVHEREHNSYEIGYTATAEQNAKEFTFEDVVELALMSMFKNSIIANSTFGWWAAWLNKTPNKNVVAPKLWYTPERAKLIASPEKADGSYIDDIIPESWIKV